MRTRKILSGIIAAAVASSILSVVPASAEVTHYTGVMDDWGTMNFSGLSLSSLDDNAVITVQAYSSGTGEWPTLVVMASDEATNWGNDWNMPFGIDADATESAPQTVTFTVGDLHDKYLSNVGADWTDATALRFTFWNGGACVADISVDTSAEAPAIPKNKVSKGSIYINSNNGGNEWWCDMGVSNASDLFGTADTSRITSVTFSCDSNISVGYNGTKGPYGIENAPDYWNQKNGTKITADDIDFSSFYIMAAGNGGVEEYNIDVSWTSKVDFMQFSEVNEGKYAQRGIVLVKLTELANVESVTMTFSDGTRSKDITTQKCYRSVTADGQKLTAPDGYVYIVATMKGISDASVPQADGGLDVTYTFNK